MLRYVNLTFFKTRLIEVFHYKKKKKIFYPFNSVAHIYLAYHTFTNPYSKSSSYIVHMAVHEVLPEEYDDLDQRLEKELPLSIHVGLFYFILVYT